MFIQQLDSLTDFTLTNTELPHLQKFDLITAEAQ